LPADRPALGKGVMVVTMVMVATMVMVVMVMLHSIGSVIFGRSTEHVPSAVASRSAEADHCKDGWKDVRLIKRWKNKK
jgi:hypothetical protein